MVRSTRTAASNDGSALSELDSWYDGPQSWTPGSDEFLRNHLTMYYVLSVLNYTAFIFVNVIAWMRYFTLRNWTYAARLLLLIAIELAVNMALVWRPTPSGAIQDESNLIYYLAAPTITYADSFVSFRLAWYWTIIMDWWRFGGFFCCCVSKQRIENPGVTKTRARYFIAFLLLSQSVVYPVITRQMYTDAIVANMFIAYAAYSFIERIWIITNNPKEAAKFDSNAQTQQQALMAMERLDSGDASVFAIDDDGTYDLDDDESDTEHSSSLISMVIKQDE